MNYPKRFLIGGIFLFVLTVLMAGQETKLRVNNWRNPVVYGWFYFSVCQCISDFIVAKNIPYVGYLQLLAFGSLFFVWMNQKEKGDFLREIRTAVLINYVIALLFCVCFRPFTEGYMYSGYWLNPNTFGHHLALVCAALISAVIEELRKKKFTWGLLGSVTGLLIAVNLMWKTQCRLAMVILGLSLVMGMAKIIKTENIKRTVLLVMTAAVLAVPVNLIWNWSIENISPMLNMQKEFSGDVILITKENSFFEMKVHAAEENEKISQNKLVRKLQTAISLDEFTSGRISIYKVYLRKMNLCGHSWRESINGISNYAHNEWLNMAYRYGIFSLIPYIVMWLGVLRNACLKYKKGEREAFFGLVLVLVFLVVSMGDCTELPFRNFQWIIPYLAIGYFFEQPIIEEQKI